MQRVHFYLALAVIVTLSLFILLGLAAAEQETRLTYWERVQQAWAIENGAELYEANCRSCHGINGEGVGELGSALNDESFFTKRADEVSWPGTLEEYIVGTVAMGRVAATRPLYAGDGQVVMTAWDQDYGGPLRPDEIHDLAAFVLNWEMTALGQVQLEELILPNLDLAGDPEEGQQVFLEAGCMECHVVAGLSEGKTGPDLTHVASVAATRKSDYTAEDYLRESFLIPNAYVVEGYEPDLGCGGVLTEAQLDDLIAFLFTLE